MMNYKQILEAIQRGINLAIDDFEDYNEPISTQKTGVIKNTNDISVILEWNKLITYIKNVDIDNVNINTLRRLSYLSKKYGFKYQIIGGNLTILTAIINWICNIDLCANLNWIDVSLVEDMSYLFAVNREGYLRNKFKGNISEWDVSNVKYMSGMFLNSEFNGDISNWNTSNVQNMKQMFDGSSFNSNISNWDVSNVINMSGMFCQNREFNQNISKWDVSNVETFESMFQGAQHFNKNLNNWDIKENAKTAYMFDQCKISPWNKPKALRRY